MWQKRFLPYAGLLLIGIVATLFLVLEGALPLTETEHFLLQILWLGIMFSALFIWSLQSGLSFTTQSSPAHMTDTEPEISSTVIDDELYDADRLWLQQHPDDDALNTRSNQ